MNDYGQWMDETHHQPEAGLIGEWACGPTVASRADAGRATMRSAATLADPSASWDDRQAALEAEAATYTTYLQAHGHPTYAEHTARQGLIREHADRGLTQIGAEHQAQAEHGGPEAGE